ncbi:MAG TPA: hypothetical protein VHQ03_09055, partial [Candidatus Dormibacteraeota bacterium]|nr:hypothetical protein [Candidatus Dormibacteraeota bacterium]
MTNIARWERIGRWFMTAWLLFLVPGAGSMLTIGFRPEVVAVLFAFAGWGITWTWLWLRALGRDHRGEVVALVAITVIS